VVVAPYVVPHALNTNVDECVSETPPELLTTSVLALALMMLNVPLLPAFTNPEIVTGLPAISVGLNEPVYVV
jgi:hypothetical protein